MNQYTINLFIAILNGNLEQVQRLIGNPNTELTFTLPNIYRRSILQRYLLSTFNAFGDYKLKSCLSSNNPLLFALSLEQVEIAEYILKHLLYVFHHSKIYSLQRTKILNSILHVNQFGLTALHILSMYNNNYCVDEQQRKSIIMQNILNMLMLEELKFVDVLNKCKPIFTDCSYNVHYNAFYKQTFYMVSSSANGKNMKFIEEPTYKTKQLLISNNIELALFFATEIKDFFDYELILTAIKTCSVDKLKEIISFDQQLSIDLINTNFVNVFNNLIHSVDSSSIQDPYLAVTDITSKMSLLFNLVYIDVSMVEIMAELLYNATNYYTRYRPCQMKGANFISWIELYVKTINTLSLTEHKCKTINKILSNINMVLLGVRTITTFSDISKKTSTGPTSLPNFPLVCSSSSSHLPSSSSSSSLPILSSSSNVSMLKLALLSSSKSSENHNNTLINKKPSLPY